MTEHTYTAYERPDKDSATSDLEGHRDFEKHFPLLCNIIFSNYQRVPEGFGLKKLKANDYPEHLKGHSDQFSSVAQSCPTLCDPMDCSTPGFPVHHQLLELAQTHIH